MFRSGVTVARATRASVDLAGDHEVRSGFFSARGPAVRDRVRRLLALTASVLLLTGCGVSIPSDPQGTLADVSGGTLKVGVSPNGDFTTVVDGHVAGSEAALVEAFAETIDANVAWTVGSEEALVRALEREDLDLVIAGLTDASPWVTRAGVTRPYNEFTDEDGKTHKLVMLVPMGENAFLTELETFLFEEAGTSP